MAYTYRASVAFTACLLFSVFISVSLSCPKGYYGYGSSCTECPSSTYKDVSGDADSCTPCPADSGHRITGSVTLDDCECLTGFSGSPSGDIPCTQITCPPLPKVFVGTFYPSACDNNAPPYSTCTLICPSGYHISHLPTSITTDTRTCLLNGTWEYRPATPTCKDYEPPVLNCTAGPKLTVNNDKGKYVSTVNWGFGFSDNSLTENEPGITKDSFTVVLTINNKNVDTKLPKLIGIGSNQVKYVVTDPAGKSSFCSFTVVVVDAEPPSCSFCPADIVQEQTHDEVRVSWDEPICSDNSGVSPSISANRQSGDLFSVPDSYQVQYTVSDGVNEYKGCSFNITLKVRTCPGLSPPQNGSLACTTHFQDSPICAFFCQNGTDFEFDPPLLYLCFEDQWEFFALPSQSYEQILPGPNCQPVADSSHEILFYYGDAHEHDVQEVIKSKFYSLLTGHNVPPFFCAFQPQCTTDSISVSPGVVG